MTVPHNKNTLLAAIDTQFQKLVKELNNIKEADVHHATMEGHVKGTTMSVANLVAYLVGWNMLVLKWIALDKAGQPIDFPETGYKWNALGSLAQKFYKDVEGVSYTELVARLHTAKAEIVAFIVATDNAVLYERLWYEKWTMGRMIQFNTASPYDNARGRLRKWIKIQGLL